MTPLTRNVVAIIAVFLAIATTQPRASAGELPHSAKGLQAEIQIGLCAPTETIWQALHLRPHGAPIKVWQFDDAALTLFERGLRLRLRVAADGRSVLTLKAANHDCAQLDAGLVPTGEGKCEYDVYGKNMAGAVSLNNELGAKRTDDLLAGRVTLAQVLSPSQVRFLREVAAAWPLPADIRKLGPMKVEIYRAKGTVGDIDITQLPDGEQFVEISRKVPREDASQAMGTMKADLSRAGIELCAEQSSQAANKLRALLR